MNRDSEKFGPGLLAISIAGSCLLILMGAVFAGDHVGAAFAYGVPLSGGPDNAWISSAALRDIAFGALGLSFALLRDRRAMGLCLLFGTIIPLGDAIVVFRNSTTPWVYLSLHLGGVVTCLILAVVFLLPRKGP
jgi:hypothetical protein